MSKIISKEIKVLGSEIIIKETYEKNRLFSASETVEKETEVLFSEIDSVTKYIFEENFDEICIFLKDDADEFHLYESDYGDLQATFDEIMKKRGDYDFKVFEYDVESRTEKEI